MAGPLRSIVRRKKLAVESARAKRRRRQIQRITKHLANIQPPSKDRPNSTPEERNDGPRP